MFHIKHVSGHVGEVCDVCFDVVLICSWSKNSTTNINSQMQASTFISLVCNNYAQHYNGYLFLFLYIHNFETIQAKFVTDLNILQVIVRPCMYVHVIRISPLYILSLNIWLHSSLSLLKGFFGLLCGLENFCFWENFPNACGQTIASLSKIRSKPG